MGATSSMNLADWINVIPALIIRELVPIDVAPWLVRRRFRGPGDHRHAINRLELSRLTRRALARTHAIGDAGPATPPSPHLRWRGSVAAHRAGIHPGWVAQAAADGRSLARRWLTAGLGVIDDLHSNGA